MTLASLCVVLLVLWTLLAYVAIPLPFEDPFFAWLRRQWLMEGIAGLAFLGVISAVFSQWRRRIPPPTMPWWNAWWVWMGWASVSLVYSVDRGASSRSVLTLLSYGLLGYLVSALVRSPRDLVVWMRFLAGAAVIAGLEGLLQYVRTFDTTLPLFERLQDTGQLELTGWGGEVIKDFLVRKRVISFFGWPNLFAGFLLLVIPLTVALSAQSAQRFSRIGWAAAGGVLGLCFLLTLSMGGWIAAIVTGSLAWWFLFQPKTNASPRSVPRLTRTLVLALALVVIMCVTSFILAKRARPMILSSFGSRVVYAQGAMNIIRAHPLTGTGTGTFGIAYRSLMPKEESEGQHSAQHAHNTLLEVGAELGVIGLGCFLVFLWQVGRLMATALHEPFAAGASIVRRGLVVGLFGFFLHSLLEQTFVESVTAPFWWIALGLVTGAASLDRSADAREGGKRKPVRSSQLALLLVICCVGLGSIGRYAAADLSAAQGAWLDLSGHHDEARAAFEHAQRYDPLTSRYPLEQGERLLKYSAGRPIAEMPSVLGQAQRAYERTVTLSPWLGQAWLRLGLVRWQLGQPDAAIEAMETAIRRDPNSRAASAHWAEMLRKTGRFKELIKAGRAFQRLEPANPVGYFWEALGWERVGSPAQTEEAYRKLLARFPDYYLALFNLATLLRQRGAMAEAAYYYEAFLRTAPATLRDARQEAEVFVAHFTAGEDQ